MTDRRAARPADAASLILLRGRPDALEVLIGRRRADLRFMPGMYVFPGGRLGPEDLGPHMGAAAELKAPVRTALTRHASLRRAVALARAALRETEEETGVVLDGPAPLALLDFVARAITPAVSPIRFHTRFFLAPGERAATEPRSVGELEDVCWRSVALLQDLPMANVTRFMLRQATERLSAPASPWEPPLYRYLGRRPVGAPSGTEDRT
jgi:8-oxo-dGTP pyrophosphatase MutT (NUDIX family)